MASSSVSSRIGSRRNAFLPEDTAEKGGEVVARPVLAVRPVPASSIATTPINATGPALRASFLPEPCMARRLPTRVFLLLSNPEARRKLLWLIFVVHLEPRPGWLGSGGIENPVRNRMPACSASQSAIAE